MIQTQEIQRDGKVYHAPTEAWIYAINQMLASRQTLKLPMKSHGYLLEIIANYKSTGTAVTLQHSEQSRPLAVSKTVGAVSEALEWGRNG